MRYAIVESGGKQYKAVEGGTIEVDKLPIEIGKKIELDDVLLVVDDDQVTVGTPRVSGAKVTATVVDQFKAKKIIVFKYKSRQRYRVKTGHRQKYTRLEIEKIVGGAAKKATAKKADETPVEDVTTAAVEAPQAEAAQSAPMAKSAPRKKPAPKTKSAPKKAATKTAPKTKSAPKKAATKTAPKTKSAPKKKAATKTAPKTKKSDAK